MSAIESVKRFFTRTDITVPYYTTTNGLHKGVVDKIVSELRLAKLIVIQLGSNDLGIKKTYEVYSDIKLGLLRLKVMCPNARIVSLSTPTEMAG
jgi:lysophospholipase L1-like esterase